MKSKDKGKAKGKQKKEVIKKVGPTKPVRPQGDSVRYYYDFLEHHWEGKQDWGNPPTMTLRDYLFSQRSEEALRAALAEENILVDDDVRIMLLDVQTAKTKAFGEIDPKTEPFYVLVLPPKPLDKNRQELEKARLDDKAWASAWYHAGAYGYGM